MSDLAIYLLFVLMGGLIFIFGIAIMVNQKYIFKRYEKDYHDYMDYLSKTQRWTFEHGAQSAENDDRIINRLDHISYDIDKIRNNKKILLTASDRGKIDEIIMALTTLGEEKMISYTEEIELLLKLRNL